MIPIVIPFYKNKTQLDRCIEHIKQQRTGQALEVFIKDNSEDNIFFTAAVNLGLLKYAFRADVEYIVVLNQDAYLEPTAIENLRLFMQATPQCGMAVPLQVLAAEPHRVICGGNLQAFPWGRHISGHRDEFKENREVPWANGCCMMIRTEMIKRIGVFDENMRFICSDSDYSFTARARGFKLVCVANAVVHHEVGMSGRASPVLSEIDKIKLEDVLYFGNKWLSGNLYRSLAWEGDSLTPAVVDAELGKLQQSVNAVKLRLAAVPPAGPQITAEANP